MNVSQGLEHRYLFDIERYVELRFDCSDQTDLGE
jgi:hypothetical protein